MNISNTKFNELNIRIQTLKSQSDVNLLLKDIQTAELYGEIEDTEAAFLINQLPLDVDESVDTYRPEEITASSGGIKMQVSEEESYIRKRVKDELDDFEVEEEKEESGFGFDPNFTISKSVPDELDEFDEPEEEEESSGFLGILGM